MRRWLVMAIGGLVALASPATAQDGSADQVPTDVAPLAQADAPMPRAFNGKGGIERADPDKSPARRAREEAQANAAEAACASGDQAGCAQLGKAYLYGEGKPQNRPAAEVVLRKACDAGAAEGCLWLGERHWRSTEQAAREAGAKAFQRACQLGSLEGCAREADAIEVGITDNGGDLAAADARRQDICARGGVSACRQLAGDKVTLAQNPAEQAEAQAVLDRLCRAGDRESCVAIMYRRGDRSIPLTPYQREILAAGCAAGEEDHCLDLADAVYADGSGPPEERSEAIALYERACDLSSRKCNAAKAFRALPALSEACSRSDRAACTALGKLYADHNSPLSSRTKAAALLGEACEAGDFAECDAAASIAIFGGGALTQEDIARGERWFMIGCDNGQVADCRTLGEELISGAWLPRDTARGYALLALACERDDTASCDELIKLAETDPDAPLPVADSRFIAPLEDGEEDPRIRQQEEASRAAAAAARARNCTSTTVTLDGVTYEDTICSPYVRVRRGFAVKPGEAPWQALIWRPAVLQTTQRQPGTNRVTRVTTQLAPGQRVLCGGSVIREGWVLTAAHCLNDVDMGSAPIKTAGHTIRLGLTNALGDEGFTYPIIATYPHYSYIPYNPRVRNPLAFDIALIQYDPTRGKRGSNAQAPARIRLDPVPLEQRKVEAIPRATVYGWGLTAVENGEIPNQLRGGRVKLRDRTSCTDTTKFRDIRRDSVLCADELQGAQGGQACSGDSGGPLVIYSDSDKVPTLIGVVSSGVKCGTEKLPSRYTRIAHPEVQKWLKQVLPPAAPRMPPARAR